jgi:hypothetical protein
MVGLTIGKPPESSGAKPVEKGKSKSAIDRAGIERQIDEIYACRFPDKVSFDKSQWGLEKGDQWPERVVVSGSPNPNFKALLIKDRTEFDVALDCASGRPFGHKYDYSRMVLINDPRRAEIVTHETEHMDAAIERLSKYEGIDFCPYYGMAFFQNESGKLSLGPFFTLLFNGESKEISPEDRYAITNAPTNKSPDDLKTLDRLKNENPGL